MRSQRDIPNTDYFEVCRKCVQAPRDELVSELELTLRDWEERAGFPDDKQMILLTGSDVTYAEWMELLERADLRMVRDDLSLEERYFAESIPENGDPVEALVEYKSRIPRAATRVPSGPRLDYLSRCIRETNVKGTVYQNLKFCEPYAIDAPFIVNQLKNRGHKVVSLEREYSPTVDQQLLNRLESFRELMETDNREGS